MIMDRSPRRGPRVLGLLTGAGLIVWSGFSLAGAAAIAPAPNDDDNDGKVRTRVMFVGEDGVVQEMEADGTFAWSSANGEAGHFAMAPMAFPDLTDFATQHPGADIDADGVVNPREHSAYLIARAMQAPEAVLAQYPAADTDGDGALSASEAASLVAPAGLLPHFSPADAIGLVASDENGGHMGMITEHLAALHEMIGLPGPGQHGALAHRLQITEDENGEHNVEVHVVAGDDGNLTFSSDDGEEILVESPDGVHQLVRVRAPATGAWVQADGAHTATCNVQIAGPDDVTSTKTQQIRIVRSGDGDGELNVEVVQNGDEEPTVTINGEPATMEELENMEGVSTMIGDGNLAFSSGNEFVVDLEEMPGLGAAHAIMIAAPFGEAAGWVMDNVDAEPSSAAVEQYLDLVPEPQHSFSFVSSDAFPLIGGTEEAEQADGLTMKERALQRLLKRYPDADANHDGTLTHDELRAFFKARHGQDGGRFRVHTTRTSDGGTTEDVIVHEKP